MFVREIIYPDFSRNFRKNFEIYEPGCHNGYKTDPQGIGQHCTAMLGRHLGKRIAFKDLPVDCKKLIQQDTKE